MVIHSAAILEKEDFDCGIFSSRIILDAFSPFTYSSSSPGRRQARGDFARGHAGLCAQRLLQLEGRGHRERGGRGRRHGLSLLQEQRGDSAFDLRPHGERGRQGDARRAEGDQRPARKLRRIAHRHLERLGADRDLAIVFQVELRGSTKFMEEFSAAGFAAYLALIRATIEEGQRAGVFRAELNAKVVSKILFGALDEMATNWILSRRRYKLPPLADQVLDIFLNGVSA